MKAIIIHTQNNLSFSKQIVKYLPPEITKKLPREIAIIAVSAKESLALNRRYRNKSKPANVLSFLYTTILLSFPQKHVLDFDRGRGSRREESGFPIRSGMTRGRKGNAAYGEIIICPAVIKKDAHIQGNSQVFQMTWMVVHGMLHLAGLHHEESQAAQRRVEKIEDALLTHIFNTGNEGRYQRQGSKKK